MHVLRAAEELNLPDWWIGAGFLRNKIWDAIAGNESNQSRDIDLVYFDRTDTSAETDWDYDSKMSKAYPFAEWEIRNQARMHYMGNFEPFESTADGIAHWVETATCVAVRLNKGQFEYLFCYGREDLDNMIARPTPYFSSADKIQTFYDRIEKKRWQERWPKLQIISA